jgi:tripartite-type tricarboxylate transporter receptor subunit TctC
MHRFRTVSLLSLIVIASLCCAQDGRQEPTWPSRSLRLIAVGAPGGSVDIPARVIAERLKDRLGQPVLVENRPQAGGTLGSETVARAAADGYTLLLAFNGAPAAAAAPAHHAPSSSA